MLSSRGLFLQPPSLLFDLDPSQLLSCRSYLQLNLPFLLNRSSLLQTLQLCRLSFNLKLSLLFLLKGDLLLSLPLNFSFELSLFSLLLFLLLLKLESFKFNLSLLFKLQLLFAQTLSFEELSLAFTSELLFPFALFLGFNLSCCGFGNGTAKVLLELFILGFSGYFMLIKPFIVTFEERDRGFDFGDQRADFLFVLIGDRIFIRLRFGVISQISVYDALRTLIVLA